MTGSGAEYLSPMMADVTGLQKSEGLGGRDVFALQQAGDGTLIAGTNRGIFLLDRGGQRLASVECCKSTKRRLSAPSREATKQSA